jgi:hypothetical protein
VLLVRKGRGNTYSKAPEAEPVKLCASHNCCALQAEHGQGARRLRDGTFYMWE